MTLFAQTAGQRQFAGVNLTDTSEVDLIVPNPGATSTLESLVACNKTGGSLDFDLAYVKDGVTFYVLYNYPIAAHSSYQISAHNLPIPSNSLIRVKSSATGLDVTAVHILNHASSRG